MIVKKILFVCLGNICRSPLAEGLFRVLVKNNHQEFDFFCDSAGTASYHIGSLPDHRSRQVAINHGFELTHKARQFTVEDFDHFDLILAMDPHNMKDIISLSRNKTDQNKVKLMRDFDTKIKDNKTVHDPYYDTIKEFEEVYQVLERCCEELLKKLND